MPLTLAFLPGFGLAGLRLSSRGCVCVELVQASESGDVGVSPSATSPSNLVDSCVTNHRIVKKLGDPRESPPGSSGQGATPSPMALPRAQANADLPGSVDERPHGPVAGACVLRHSDRLQDQLVQECSVASCDGPPREAGVPCRAVAGKGTEPMRAS